MDAQVKAKWIDALRSGKYQQGHGNLRSRDCFCCLGVLCEVSGLRIDEDGIGVAVEKGGSLYGPIYELIGNSDIAIDLFKRNDGICKYEKHSFAEIADHIEKTL